MKYKTFIKEYWFALDLELEIVNATKEEWIDITIEDYSLSQYLEYIEETFDWKKKDNYLKEAEEIFNNLNKIKND